VPKEIDICERSRCDLVTGWGESFNKLNARLVPTGREPENSLIATMAINHDVLFLTELQTMLQITVSGPKRIFAGSRQFLGGVHDIDIALLELDSVTTSLNGNIYESQSTVDLPVMIDANFSYDKIGFIVSDESISYFDRFHMFLFGV
jgi:hypothetical protein